MERTPITRKILFKGEELADLNPNLPIQNMLALWSMQRPELTNAMAKLVTTHEPDAENPVTIEEYEVFLVEGTKG